MTTAWWVGAAVDDIRAARAAGVVPLGLSAAGDGAALTAAGAARVLDRLEQLEGLLP